MKLEEKLDDLNRMILKGEILESMDKYYHPDCIVIERNDVVANGLEQAKARESDLFEGIEAWLKSEVVSTATGENVTMTEWHFEYKHKDLGHKKFDQVAVQHWKDGKSSVTGFMRYIESLKIFGTCSRFQLRKAIPGKIELKNKTYSKYVSILSSVLTP